MRRFYLLLFVSISLLLVLCACSKNPSQQPAATVAISTSTTITSTSTDLQSKTPLSSVAGTTITVTAGAIFATATAPVTLALQRPPVDDFVKVQAPFILGSPHTPLPTDPSKSVGIFVIPYGSVIYHWANGITEVFGPDEKRILIAKDSEAGVWVHPIPYVPPPGTMESMTTPDTYVVEFSDGSTRGSNVVPVTTTTIKYLDNPQNLTNITSPEIYQQS
jgi:hypothetical protein